MDLRQWVVLETAVPSAFEKECYIKSRLELRSCLKVYRSETACFELRLFMHSYFFAIICNYYCIVRDI